MKNPVKFGKYYLLERINVGGMAEVFKAKSFGEAGFERLVAVKRVLPSIAEDQEFIAMFIDEAKLAVQLTHPNIAQIFELGKVGEAYFIALEYVPGKDLRAIFDRGRKRGEPLPIPMASYMVMKICEGLDYAHNKKDAAGRNIELVHRDVSPQNMLISYEGDVKLIDFGIAKAASKSSRTQAGILKGKFGYMSPEQVRGLQIDRRSDIFSVGICLYELLTMERLFVGESDFSTLEKVRNVEIMPPSTYNRKIPEELEQIVLKALAKHPEDRYRTAMDLHDDLQSFMYTSGNFFARKDLSAYMHRIFQDEIAKEASKDDEYRKFDSRRASDLDVFDNAAPASSQPRNTLNAPPPPPVPPRASLPPPPPPQAMAVSSRGLRATMMGVGMSPAVATAAVTQPPVARPAPTTAPPQPHQPQKAMIGGAAAATAAAPANGHPAIDMDWDDEELATQVYDKPDGMPMSMSMPMPPRPSVPPPVPTPSRPPPSSNPQINASAAAKMQVGAAAAAVQFAGPRQPTGAMPAISAPPPRSLPQIPAPPAQGAGQPNPQNGYGPAISAPGLNGPGGMGMAATMAQQPMYPQQGMGPPMQGMGPPMQMGQPMQSGPMQSAQMQGAQMQGPPRGNNAMYPPQYGPPMGGPQMQQPRMNGGPQMMGPAAQFAQDRQITVAAPPPERNRRSGAVILFAGLGVVAVAAAMVVGLKLFAHGGSAGPTATAPPPVVAPVVPTPVAANVAPVQPPPPVVAPVVAPAVAPAVVPAVPAAVQPPPPVVAVAPTPVAPTEVAVAPTPVAPVVVPRHHAYVAPVVHEPPPPHVAATHPHETQVAAARPTHAEPASSGGGTGLYSVSTQPASRCSIAGQTFSTPRLGLELPAGSYRITCQNADFNVSASWMVTIHAGERVLNARHQLN